MTREQMIAWLTLEGWEPTIVVESRYLRHIGRQQYINYSALIPRIYKHPTGAYVSTTPNSGWNSWADADIRRVMGAADADA